MAGKPTAWGFKSKQDAETLKLVARERRNNGSGIGGVKATIPEPTSRARRNRLFKNVSDETIPPYAICAIVGVEQDPHGPDRILVDKPDTTFRRLYLVNAHLEVEAGKNGFGWSWGDLMQAYDDASTPVSGESWGPKPGSWLLHKGYPATADVLGVSDDGSGSSPRLLGTHHAVTTLLCKATADHGAGVISDDYQIWSGTEDDGEDAGFTELPEIELASAVEEDDFFVAHYVNGHWRTAKAAAGAPGTKLYRAALSAALSHGDSSASIDGVTSFDSEEAPTPTTANNFLSLAGENDDTCVIIEDTSGDDPVYYLLNVKHHDCPEGG